MPISPPPVGRWLPEYIPAYLSNGVIGLRAGPIPLIEGVAIVNGLAAIDPVEKGEGLARAPYPIGGDLEVDGAELSRRPGQAVLVEQHYDFACGELSSRFSFHPTDATATVDVLTFCSRSLPSVVLQEVQVRVDRNPDPTPGSGDDWGPWDKLVPFENVYDHIPYVWSFYSNVSYCNLTPADTGSAPPAPRGVHETMCFPLGVWSHCGSAWGIGSTMSCPGPGTAGAFSPRSNPSAGR